MNSTEKVIPFPQRTRLLCSQCGAKGEMGCGCGVEYIKPVEFAASAVAANPEKSDRAIAEETGVSDKTVAKARRSTGAENSAPAKRKGRDGKNYSKPKPKPRRAPGERQHQASVNSNPADWEAFKTKAHDQGISAAALLGAIIAGPEIDPATLSLTAQAKLASAERQMRRAIEAEHAARRAALDEEVRQKVLTQNKEYVAMLNRMEREARETTQTYRDFMGRQTKIFTKDEYKLVVMCVHADASISVEKRNDATRLLIAKRFALTGEK